MEFNFPFTTCEVVHRGVGDIAQPWSTLVNVYTCWMLVRHARLDARLLVRVLLASYAAFEAWHALSHAVHVQGTVQADVVHVLGYAMSFCTLFAILALSRTRLGVCASCAIAAAVVADVYVWLNVRGVWTVFTGLLVFAAVVLSQLGKLHPTFRRAVPSMVGGLLLLFALFANETRNCSAMMSFATLPYHVLIETVGFALFDALARGFRAWPVR